MDPRSLESLPDWFLGFLAWLGVSSSILFEALPFVLLGAIIAGFLEELLPQGMAARLLPRNHVLAIMIGGLLGLIFPMCECGIIPVMRRLLRKGVPLSCCVAYLLAGPIINVVVILSTFIAFSGKENDTVGGQSAYQMGSLWMTGLRMALGYLVAVGTSLIVEWQYRRHGNKLLAPLAVPSGLPLIEEGNGAPAVPRTWGKRASNIAATALHDFIDVAVFLVLGACLAGLVRVLPYYRDLVHFAEVYPLLGISLMMVLAVVLCLCSEADAFVAASFTGLRPAAKLAFLVLGPMLDFKLYFMYTRVFKARLIATIFVAVVIQVLIYSYLTNYFWETYAPQWFPHPPPTATAAP